MNFKNLSGLAAVTVLMTMLGSAQSGCATPVTASALASEDNSPEALHQPHNSPNTSPVVSTLAEETKVGEVVPTTSDAPSSTEVPAIPQTQPQAQIASEAVAPVPEAPAATQARTGSEAEKVGEYQSTERAEEAIAVMQSYESEGRQVSTLYVRNIPVLSFLGTEGAAPHAEVKVSSPAHNAATEVEVSQPRQTIAQLIDAPPAQAAAAQNADDSVVRATAIAAQINQLHRNGVDANSIRAVWDESKQRYLIKVGEDLLTAIDPATILPDTTNNAEQDALQAANRLRRLLGNAEPLTEVEGAPKPETRISVGPIEFTVSGYASWYGPGFNGNLSASGEVFNENAMTAAHPDLPFGTQVRVTNMDNGLSVVVRINDRGPYVGDRIIDLSAGAADVIGLTNSGVAPVKLEVLGAASN